METSTAHWSIMLNLKQPCMTYGSGPQGLRSQYYILRKDVPLSSLKGSRARAVSLANAYSPPIWSNKDVVKNCTLCSAVFSMFSKGGRGHHCRNCGQLVCFQCATTWPGLMVPRTYHNHETAVCICDACDLLASKFVEALATGDLPLAQALYRVGNVNVMSPYYLVSTMGYPIHFAVAGCSLPILRWLLEDLHVPIVDTAEEPLKSAEGMTILAIAAKYAQLEIMRYLIDVHRCDIAEIVDVVYLRRALHVSLQTQAPLPRSVANFLGDNSDDSPEPDVTLEHTNLNTSLLSAYPGSPMTVPLDTLYTPLPSRNQPSSSSSSSSSHVNAVSSFTPATPAGPSDDAIRNVRQNRPLPAVPVQPSSSSSGAPPSAAPSIAEVAATAARSRFNPRRATNASGNAAAHPSSDVATAMLLTDTVDTLDLVFVSEIGISASTNQRHLFGNVSGAELSSTFFRTKNRSTRYSRPAVARLEATVAPLLEALESTSAGRGSGRGGSDGSLDASPGGDIMAVQIL